MMDPRIEERRRAVREQRARGSMSRFLLVLIIVALSGLIVWTLFRAPLFSIRHLEINGAATARSRAAQSHKSTTAKMSALNHRPENGSSSRTPYMFVQSIRT